MRAAAVIRRTPTFTLVLACLLGLAVYYALLTHFAFAADARRILAVRFVGIPNRPEEALSIWLHNSRVVLGVAVVALIARFVPKRRSVGHRGAEHIPLLVSDVILGVWAVGTVALAGVLAGAYGSAQLRAFMPDGPVEVTAWALLITLYIDARRRRGSGRRLLLELATVEGLLAIAAVLEVGGLIR